MTEEQRIAEEAKRLLDNEILKKAFNKIEQDAFEASLKAFTDKRRRHLLDKVTAIRDIRKELQALINSAKFVNKKPPSVA